MQFLGTHWQEPIWLIMLPMTLVIGLLCFKKHTTKNDWQKICDPHLLKHLLIGSSHPKQQWPWILLAIAWLLTIVALAGPSWQKKTIPIYQHKQAYIILFDTSDAMLSDDLKPSRLIRARYKVSDILDYLKDAQVGVLAFAGESYAIAPITDDAHTIKHLINKLSPEIMPVPGYQLDIALEQAQHMLQQSNINNGKIIVLTAGPVSKNAINIARKIHHNKIDISVLALGSEEGAPIQSITGKYLKDQHGNILMSQRDTRGLQELATAGGGHYANFSNDDHDIHLLFATQATSLLHTQPSAASNQIIAWKNQGYLFLYPLLLIVALCFRRGWLSGVLS
jgi:Ca-activated chloride channel homolog